MDSWTPPIFDILNEPTEHQTFKVVQCGDHSKNFARCAKIAPDGSGFIAQCEDHSLQLFEFLDSKSPLAPGGLVPRLNLKQASPVVDFAWFPSASKQDPATYCFVSSVRETPVKLLDATTGKLRASYRIVDHRERQIAPHALAFTYSGERLFCGFEDAIEVFDVARPGEGKRRHTSPSKKSKDGLKGIISALTFSPTHSASDDSLFAAGSLTPVPGNISLFSEAGGEAVMSLGGGPYDGVTQLRFNHYRPHMLYAAYRGNANGLVYSWDLRSQIDVPLLVYDSRPVVENESRRGGEGRNQKVRFDLDIGGRYIATGNSAGEIVVFDVEKAEAEYESKIAVEDAIMAEGDEVDHRNPNLRFKAHNDTIGSVAFQPWKAELLSVAGSRHFDAEPDEDSSDEDSDEKMDRGVALTSALKSKTKSMGPCVLDSSMKLWDFAPKAPEASTQSTEPSGTASGSAAPDLEQSVAPVVPVVEEPQIDKASPEPSGQESGQGRRASTPLEWELDLD